MNTKLLATSKCKNDHLLVSFEFWAEFGPKCFSKFGPKPGPPYNSEALVIVGAKTWFVFLINTITFFLCTVFSLCIAKYNWNGDSCAGGREFVSQRLAKSYTALQTVRHHSNIYVGSCVALALRRGDGRANSLHASA